MYTSFSTEDLGLQESVKLLECLSSACYRNCYSVFVLDISHLLYCIQPLNSIFTCALSTKRRVQPVNNKYNHQTGKYIFFFWFWLGFFWSIKTHKRDRHRIRDETNKNIYVKKRLKMPIALIYEVIYAYIAFTYIFQLLFHFADHLQQLVLLRAGERLRDSGRAGNRLTVLCIMFGTNTASICKIHNITVRT